MNDMRDTAVTQLSQQRVTIDRTPLLYSLHETEHQAYRLLRKGKGLILFLTAIGITLAGAIVWILNTLSVLQGSWSGIMGILFTTGGMILTLLQLHIQLTASTEVSSSTSSPSPTNHALVQVNKRKGALIVKVKKQFRGTTLILSRGFDQVDHQHDLAANVVEHMIGHQRIYIGIFPFIEPGNYLVATIAGDYVAKVTIYAGHIVEVDWR